MSPIDATFADEILTAVRVGADFGALGRGGIDRSEARSDLEREPIEASYLQLVMSRLWTEEVSHRQSRELRKSTYDELGARKASSAPTSMTRSASLLMRNDRSPRRCSDTS